MSVHLMSHKTVKQDGAKGAGSSETAELLDIAMCSGVSKPQDDERRKEKQQYLRENGDYDVTKDP
jgi:hypothetical protein